jgi:hypothetical protein
MEPLSFGQILLESFRMMWKILPYFIIPLLVIFPLLYLEMLLKSRRRRQRNLQGRNSLSYSDKLQLLLQRLKNTSDDVDEIIAEYAQICHAQVLTVERLNENIEKLKITEKEYTEKIEDLKNLPLPVIDHLLKQLEPSERRSMWRDIMLFILGLIISPIIAYVLKSLGILL